MNIIKLKVNNFEIIPEEKSYVIENQVNEFALEFVFDDSWEYENKYVVFDNEETTYKRPIINNQVIIPSELLNGRTTIQIYAQDVENNKIVKRKPSFKYSFSILNSLSPEGIEETDLPTPSQWEIYISQIEEMCDDLQDQFDDLKEECEAKCDDVIERLAQDEQDIQTNTDNIRTNAEAIDKLNTSLLDYSLITETGNKISMSINSQTYVITLNLKDKNDNVLSTQSIDLPLETMIVNASYSNDVLTFTLKNGQTLQVPISDLISGLVSTDTFNQTVQGLSNRITTIENDYLKSTDKTELQEQITANADDIDDIQEEQITQNADIESLQQENERLSRIVSGLPTKNASGTNIVLNDMVNCEIKEISLKGDNLQDGTPTPDTPVEIQTVKGNQEINVFGVNIASSYFKSNDIARYYPKFYVEADLRPSTTYTLSFKASASGYNVYTNENLFSGSVQNVTTTGQRQSITFTTKDTISKENKNQYNQNGWLMLKNGADNSDDITFSDIQLEVGSNTSDYEQYNGTNCQVSLGNIELCKIGDYQDKIYKSNDKWYLEKNIGKDIFNGSENWYLDSGQNYFFLSNVDKYYLINSVCISNYLKFGNINENNTIHVGNWYYPMIKFTQCEDATQFKEWLSNHNLIVYYIKATPVITEITDTTLISQLNSIYDIILNTNNTIITNGELPTIIDITGYVDIMSLISTQENRSVQEETRKVEEPIEEPIETKEEEK